MENNIDYITLTDRMKKKGELKNDSALARDLGVTPQALSNYKKRGSMPMSLVLKFAKKHETSMDWLLSGIGSSTSRDEIAATGVSRGDIKDIAKFSGMEPEVLITLGKALKVLKEGNDTARGILTGAVNSSFAVMESTQAHNATGKDGGNPTTAHGG